MSGFKCTLDGLEATRRAAERLAPLLLPGDCLALDGELGAGKTQFTKHLAKALGVVEPVVSPSFNLLLEYRGRMPLRHLDAYFAARESALLDESCAEVFGSDGIAVVEWAERVRGYLPQNRLEIRLDFTGESSRSMTVSGYGVRGEEIARSWQKILEEAS